MTQVFGILRCFTCFFFPCVFGVPGVERRSAWDPMLADKFGWQKLVLFNSFLWAFLSIYRRTEICVLCCSLKFQNILNELLNWRIGASCWDDAYAPFKFQRTLWMSSSIGFREVCNSLAAGLAHVLLQTEKGLAPVIHRICIHFRSVWSAESMSSPHWCQ